MGEVSVAAIKEKKWAILTNPNFMLLFIGGVVSRIGNGIHYIGLVWYIMEQNGSGAAVGTILMIATLPGVVLGPFAGVLVDRFDRKKIIVWMDIIRGAVVLGMAGMIITHTMTYGYLILGTVLLGVCGSLFNPAVSASIPNLVKDNHLTKANSLEHMSMNVTGMIGPAIGGILVGIWGVAGVFLINGISFLLSALSEMFIKFPTTLEKIKESKTKINFWVETKEGLSFIYNQKALYHLLFVCLFANFLYAGASVVGLPLIVRDALGGSAKDLGVFEAAWPIGAAVGGLILSLLPEIKKVFKIFVGSISIQTFFWMIVGVMSLPMVVSSVGIITAKVTMIGLLIICGIFNAFINVPMMVIFQRMIPDDKRGRIFALTGTISQGLVPIAIGLSGLIAELVIPGYLYILSGVGVFIIMLNFVRKKEVRTM